VELVRLRQAPEGSPSGEGMALAEAASSADAEASERAEAAARDACAAERDHAAAALAAREDALIAEAASGRETRALEAETAALRRALDARDGARAGRAKLDGSAEGRLAAAVARIACSGPAGIPLALEIAELVDAAREVLGTWSERRARMAAEASAEVPTEPDRVPAARAAAALEAARAESLAADRRLAAARGPAAEARKARDLAGRAAEDAARALGEARRRHLAAGSEALAHAERLATLGTLAGAAEDLARRGLAEAAEARRRAEELRALAEDGCDRAANERERTTMALDHARRAQGALEALGQARATAQARQGLAWAADAAETAIREVRRELLEEAVRPLLADVGRFLAAAGLPHVPELRLLTAKGRAACELGWVPAGSAQLVPVESLSGGEAVLFGAALSAALCRRRPGRRVLLLEADPCDAENVGRLLRGLAATAPEDATVLVATNRALTSAPAGWTIRTWTGAGWTDAAGKGDA